MSLAIINLNDASLQLALDGDLVSTSPGYAVLNNDKLLTGETAAQNTKLLPRWTNSRFWSQLSMAPIAGATSQVRHHADIAFSHLEDLWKAVAADATDAIFVVPGYYDQENLSLLLGIAKECGIPVRGVIDHSVVIASNLPLQQKILHLDIHLHAITLTTLTNTGTIRRQGVKTVVETGLATLWDRWSAIIANQFIQSTRFDPMHDAGSEQQLFDQLPGWIAALPSSNMHNFSLTSDAGEHNVAISNESLMRACAPLYPQIVQAIREEIGTGEQTSVLLSHQFMGFPGLQEALKLVPEINLVEAGELKAIGSANLHQDKILSEAGTVSHILQLDAGEVEPSQISVDDTPTHILYDHTAYPIGDAFKLSSDLSQGPRHSDSPGCTLYIRNGELRIDGQNSDFRLNGATFDNDAVLAAGDSVSIGEHAVTLIRVKKGG